ncbi:hypothetical protein [Poseidonocella pacifica]|uniref:hypothetical protein n=1 Tax=Poseidonocella pacifica TaxID=871651 RepID=UPI001587B163|nr:hypothetical protein [Poseidonocella pacifica]
MLRFGARGPQSYERLYVDPQDVQLSYCKHLPDVPSFSRRHSGAIVGGDWDRATRDIEASPKMRACRLHFEEGQSWEDTGIFDYMMARIENGKPFDSCHNLDDVHERYRQIDALYESIRRAGVIRSRAHHVLGVPREGDGIFIHFGRDGHPIFGMIGNHRMAIARILKLPRIPVQLGVLHKEAFEAGHLTELRQGSAFPERAIST